MKRRRSPASQHHFHKSIEAVAEILDDQCQVVETVQHCREEPRIKPDSPEARNHLAWLPTASEPVDVKNPAAATPFAGHAFEPTHHGVTPFAGTLRAVYAEAG